MRCGVHPQRLAGSQCAVCGRWICEHCCRFNQQLAAVLCADCQQHAERAGGGRNTAAETPAPRIGLVLSLGSLLLLSVMLWLLVSEPLADRDLAAGYEALEQVGLALEAYLAMEGRLPPSLEVLVPDYMLELPEDPTNWGGAALMYRPEPKPGRPPLLYSRGPDDIDQGGMRWDAMNGSGDLLYPID